MEVLNPIKEIKKLLQIKLFGAIWETLSSLQFEAIFCNLSYKTSSI